MFTCLMLLLCGTPDASAANISGISLEVPATARIGEIIKVKVNITGGSEGIWFSTTGLRYKRGYFNHSGFCYDKPCLVNGEIKTYNDCCGPYCLGCAWSSGHEFAVDWFGGPTIEYEVTGCGTASVTPTFLGSSHEGPYTLARHEIKVLDGIVADFKVSAIGCIDEEILFDNTSCGGISFLWNFGDGRTSTEKSPVHTYTSEGTYAVTLTANGPPGTKPSTKTTTVDIRSKCATVAGTCLFAPAGTPLAGVEISASGGTPPGETIAVSDADGHYSMVIGANEPYLLFAKKPGFVTAEGPTVTLKPGQFRTWNVALQPEMPERIRPESLLGDQPTNVEDPVNPAIGNYYFSQSLFRFPGVRGIGLNFQVAYNSAAAHEQGPIGFGWTHSYHVRITQNADQATVHFGDGHKEFFRRVTGTDQYKAFNCHPSIELSKTGTGGWKANIGGGLYWEFDSDGRLLRIHDLNDNAITLHHSTQLDRITDTQGRMIQFHYTDGLLARITSPLVESGDTVLFSHDRDGNLVGLSDPRGNSWRFTYDAGHRLLTETDRRGLLVLTNGYDPEGRVVDQRDALGHTTHIRYEKTPYGKRAEVTLPSGQKYTHEYDAGDNLIAIVDTQGLRCSLAPGANGKPVGIVDRRGRSASFESNALGLPTAIRNRLGASTRIHYNDKYQVTSVVDQFGRTDSFGYDARGNLVSLADRNFDYAELRVNSRGQPQTILYPGLGGIWELTYRSDGSLAAIRDRDNQTTAYQYDAAGRVIQINHPAGFGTFKKQYDANGNVLSLESPLSHRTTFTYNENNQTLTRTFEPTGAVTTYIYDESGRLQRIVDPLGGTEKMAYDAIGNLVSFEDADGVVTRFSHAAQNRLGAITAPSGRETRFGYDPDGKRVWMQNQSGHVWQWTYDAEGRRTSSRDPLGNLTRYERNEKNTLFRVTNPLNQSVERRFDDTGRLTGVTYPDGAGLSLFRNAGGLLNHLRDERGVSRRYGYDHLGRLISATDPAQKVERYEYDARGRVVGQTRRTGGRIQYAYDQDDRLTSMTLPGGAAVTLSYEHDRVAGTNTVRRTDAAGTVTEVYNNAGRLISQTDIWGITVSFAYTPAGRLKQIIYPGNRQLDYSYDRFGRLQQIRDWNGDQTLYSYDALDRVALVALPNGTRTVYTHDARNRVTGIRHLKPDGSDLLNLAYVRDALGRIAQAARTPSPPATVSDRATDLEYDPANRLLTSTSGSEATAYRFDENGNLSEKTAGSVVTQYQYDPLDRLAKVADGVHSTLYGYDARGTRVSKNHDGTVTRYQRHGDRVLSLLAEDNNPIQFNVYSNRLLYGVDASGMKRIYHTDVRGSVVAISDGTGELLQSYAYSPHGKLIGATGPPDRAFGFVGGLGVLTDENGLQHMRARYYDPEIGRFISEDPSGTAFGPNLYGYAANDPINRIDPGGLRAEDLDLPEQPADTGAPYTSLDSWNPSGDPGGEEGLTTRAFQLVETASGEINTAVALITPDVVEDTGALLEGTSQPFGDILLKNAVANPIMLNAQEVQEIVKATFMQGNPFTEASKVPGSVGGVYAALVSVKDAIKNPATVYSALRLALRNPTGLQTTNPYYIYLAGTSVGTASVATISAVVIIGAVGGWETGRAIGAWRPRFLQDPSTGKYRSVDENLQWMFYTYFFQ